MRVILDTNVVISAVYFGGEPLKILRSFQKSIFDKRDFVGTPQSSMKTGFEVGALLPGVAGVAWRQPECMIEGVREIGLIAKSAFRCNLLYG